jgi:copper(I)-binding protein
MLLLAAPVRPAVGEAIQLERQHGAYMVPVRINETIILPFIVDSGSAEVSIPTDVFLTLLRSGTVKRSDFVGPGTYILADGSEQSSDRFILHQVSVGNHIVRDVVANVAPVKGDPLLGQSFLSRLPGWTIDNQRHVLVLNDLSASVGSQQRAALPPSQTTPSVAIPAPQPPLSQTGRQEVSNAWARATPANAESGIAFLTIRLPVADRLISVSSSVAKKTELHASETVGNVMRMWQLAGLDIPAGQPIVLQPGGMHIMLIGLNGPLREGQTFPLMLTFERAGSREVTVVVERPGAMAATPH